LLDPIYDECGIAAVYEMDPGRVESVVPLLPEMLMDLQNRGQLAAGIASFNEARAQVLDSYKDVGSVNDVFHLTLPDPSRYQKILKEYSGRAGIGHVRYATCGRDDPSYAQPFERHHGRRWKWFSFCFNGNVANFREVRSSLIDKGYHLVRDTDTELIMHHLSYALREENKPDVLTVFGHLAEVIDGAFSLAFLNADGDMVLARDPQGFRPLCYGTKGSLFAAASESLALANRGFTEIHDLEPGELIHVAPGQYPDGFKVHRFAPAKRKSFCFFEYVYFANVASKINGRSVYLTRSRLGEALAQSETVPTDPADCVVVPVPDTAKAACDAMAYKLGIPSHEGLMRNRYLGRTFIEGRNRMDVARRKYTALPEVLEGKKVFLVEDSIVRSTTLRVIINMLRTSGRAKEIHVRVACPPIMAPCAYGIDMSTVRELFAPKHLEKPTRGVLPEDELARATADLGADSLRYLTVEELVQSIGLPENELCLACLTGSYPSPWGEKMYAEALCRRDEPEAVRTYERLEEADASASPSNP